MLQVIQRFIDSFHRPPAPDSRADDELVERIFHRPVLANQLAAKLRSRSFASGMFLTGPRRTGKSTFIRRDLVPALERNHRALVLYADLWERRAEDPGDVIVGLVETALAEHERLASSAFRRWTLKRLKVPGVELELDESTAKRRPSLYQSIKRLSDLARRTVVLIIDEAHHTQTTQSGRDVLFMLKSARDQLNDSPLLMFRVLMTGSHHAKIERPVRHKNQAFFCAPLQELPTLGDADYLAWERASNGPDFLPELADMHEAFDVCLRRPELFHAACQDAAAMPASSVQSRGSQLMDAARHQIELAKQSLLNRVRRLAPMDQAVLRLMAEDGPNLMPFFPSTERRLIAMLADQPTACVTQVSWEQIQASFARLGAAGLVWSGDGPEVLEESQHAKWLLEFELPLVHANDLSQEEEVEQSSALA